MPHYDHKSNQIITTAKVNNLNGHHSDKEKPSQKTRSVDNNSDDESEILNLKIKQAKLNEDLEKYRELLELKQKLIEKKLSSTLFNGNKRNKNPINELDINDFEETLNNNKDRTSNNFKQTNDIDKLNRLKNLINNYAKNLNLEKEDSDEQPAEQSMTQNRSFFKHQSLNSLNDEFRKALGDLEMKMIEFEREMSRLNGDKQNSSNKSNQWKFSSMPSSSSSSNSSSYTLTLIKILSTLIDHFKEMSLEVNYEKLKQAEANKQLDIHRKLIDGLTTEILCVKEQNEKIITEYAGQQAKIESELDQIKVNLIFFSWV